MKITALNFLFIISPNSWLLKLIYIDLGLAIGDQ
jgi:hypothetical protein